MFKVERTQLHPESLFVEKNKIASSREMKLWLEKYAEGLSRNRIVSKNQNFLIADHSYRELYLDYRSTLSAIVKVGLIFSHITRVFNGKKIPSFNLDTVLKINKSKGVSLKGNPETVRNQIRQLFTKQNAADRILKVLTIALARLLPVFPIFKSLLGHVRELTHFFQNPSKEKYEILSFKFKYFCREAGYISSDPPTLLQKKRTIQLLVRAAQEAFPLLISNKSVVWLNGSGSASIPMMEHFAKISLSDKPALIPTAKLLEKNLEPLVNEKIWDPEIFSKRLNGTSLIFLESCTEYNESHPTAVDEPILNFLNEKEFLNLKITVLRKALVETNPKKRAEIERQLQELRLNKDSFSREEGTVEESWGAENEDNVTTLDPTEVEKIWAEEDDSPINKKKDQAIKDLLELFQKTAPLPFSTEDNWLIKSNFPIVWASYSIKPQTPKKIVHEDMEKVEKLAVKKAVLGEDIQIIFAEKPHHEILKQKLNKYKVHVYSFEAAHYLKVDQVLFRHRSAYKRKRRGGICVSKENYKYLLQEYDPIKKQKKSKT